MSFEIQCDRCGSFLAQPGGLAFSPPDDGDECMKYHLCVECWAAIEPWLWGRVDDLPAPPTASTRLAGED